ncbi:MAG: PBECR4 domain-containing protein [Catonella sp.]|uniref:PBECR4 domain-containing protein n=1 Tax=Catonella sp. TaxID=2382125 RepID=UPI003F9EC47E
MQKSFDDRVVGEIIRCSKLYKQNLTSYDYLIISESFKINEFYLIDCKCENYMHLTGVRTTLKPMDFFNKCIDESITTSDFICSVDKHIKGTVRRKLKVLDNMVNIFSGKELFFEENFEKNKVICSLATSDLKCTLGFIGKSKIRPMTLLSGNTLRTNNKIELILRKEKEQSIFNEVVYGGWELKEKYYDILTKNNFI